MNLPHLLQQLEQGHTSAAQAEQEIRDEIERLKELDRYDVGWSCAFDALKVSFGLYYKESTKQ